MTAINVSSVEEDFPQRRNIYEGKKQELICQASHMGNPTAN